MIKIENRLKQPLVIHLGRGRMLHLLAGGKAVIDEDAAESGEIQELAKQKAITKRPLGTEPTYVSAATQPTVATQGAETLAAPAKATEHKSRKEK